MTRLKKELTNRNIIWDADDYMIMMGPEHDTCSELVDITDQFVITCFHSAVLDPILHLYDRKTLQLIAYQDLYKDTNSFNLVSTNPWNAWFEYEA